MNVRPIRTDRDHARALSRIDELMGAEPGTSESDELEVLTTLVVAYEDENFPIDDPDPASAIRFRMDQMGLTRRDLEPLLGSRGRVSEILNGRRPLSIGMIRRLHRELGIPVESLLGKG